MGFFEPHSRITIGDHQFSGVHELRIVRGLRYYADSAVIRIPSIGYIQGRNSSIERVTMGTMIQEGDKVKIELGYETPFDHGKPVLREEFRGFVKKLGMDMPLTVECEGYVRQLRLNSNLNGSYKSTTAKKLLEAACAGTDIKVVCPVDFPLKGIHLQHADGCDVIEHIKKCSCGALSIFFLQPDILWCGLVNTAYLAGSKVLNLPTVNYRLGWNTPKDNGLKVRVPKEHVQVIINGKLATADGVRTESKDKTAKRKVRMLQNNVGSDAALEQFAQEVANNMNYTGYEGHINAMLQPFASPGYVAHVVDARYGKQDGDYLVDGTEVTFGQNGAKRRVSIGVKLG